MLLRPVRDVRVDATQQGAPVRWRRLWRHRARRPEDLYPGRRDLQAKHSVEVADGWLLGTNTNTPQKKEVIRAAADVAGLKFGVDIVVDL